MISDWLIFLNLISDCCCQAAEWLHWLVVNIPGDKLEDGKDIGHGKVLMQHNGPSPPKGTGKIFQIYLKANAQLIMESKVQFMFYKNGVHNALLQTIYFPLDKT